jgi:hypothetical protein
VPPKIVLRVNVNTYVCLYEDMKISIVRGLLLIPLCALSCGAEKTLGNIGTISFTLTASWTFPSPEEPALLLVADTKRGLSESSQGASVKARFRVTEIQQPVDPKEYETARFTSMSKQQSLRIDWETMAIPAPDVSDRSTLLNLARGSWDAYHPMPEASANWYPLEGFNWVRVLIMHLIFGSGSLVFSLIECSVWVEPRRRRS